MRIYVKENEGKRIKITIPTDMVLNRLTAHVAKRCIVKHDKSNNINISVEDINKLFSEIKKFKRKYPGLPLVDVEGKDGDRVYIKL